MGADYRPGLKTHLSIGVFYGTLLGIVQGLAEALILSIRYSGHILTPQATFNTQAFYLIGKLLGLDESASIPFILDRYLGHSFIDKISLVYDLIVAYSILGLIAGLCLGLILWIVFKFVKAPLGFNRLSMFYLSLILSSAVFINLIIWLNRGYLKATLSISSLLVDLGLIVGGLLVIALIYRLGCTLIRETSLEGNKTLSSKILLPRGKVTVLFAGLLTCIALFLWVSRQDKAASEIFAPQTNHSAHNRPISLKDNDINVILISIDSLRADHLSCYGYYRKTSPNIDSLASEGIIFSKAFSTTSWTLPAHMSMLTSMYPEAHGVITDRTYLDENRITLAEVLKEEGYATAAFVSGHYLHSIFGFRQGFDLYDDFTINVTVGLDAASQEQVNEMVSSPSLNGAIQRWLKNNYQKKFFLFLHYYDVHYDYIPPPPFDKRFDPGYAGTINARNFYHNNRINPEMSPRDLNHIIALYDGEIAFTDKYIGELLSTLKKLGIYGKTIIVLTSDHGEEFFEHGGKSHGKTLYEEVIHVPMIIKFPSDSSLKLNNRRVDEVISIIDIMPTVLGYIGIKPNVEMQGRSLVSLVNDNKKDSLIYSSLKYELVAVRSADLKLIHHLQFPEKELYNLVNDPGEKVNLLDKAMNGNIANKEEKHLTALLDWINTQHQLYQALPQTDDKKDLELSEEMKDELKALGYMQ